MSKKAIIIIPCFNEASRLNFNFFEAFLERPDLELLFVDDGSSDDTAARLKEWGSPHPARTTLLELSRNGGKGEAVRQGMQKAFGKGL